MNVSDFSFDLPAELIAQYPLPERSASRLLTLDGNTGVIAHHSFKDILQFLQRGDLLVFNDTRVIPARLHGKKLSGGKIEVLVERCLDAHTVLAHVRNSRSLKIGDHIILADVLEAKVMGREEDCLILQFLDERPIITLLEQYGHMPLPLYINREDELVDKTRYQTVYNRYPGAVAAPTAGLHFDETLMAALAEKGVNKAFVTLHVGAGTFQPVRVDNIEDHVMHQEWVQVLPEVCEAIALTKQRGGRVIAVGTTSVRSLETAALNGGIKPFEGETKIFIYPGFQFQVVDALLTNFHLPQSTLMMLVCAFGGFDAVMAAYRAAVVEKYRFFSYGDAMFINRRL